MMPEDIRQCPTCEGSGSYGFYFDDGSPALCPECGGEGVVTYRETEESE